MEEFTNINLRKLASILKAEKWRILAIIVLFSSIGVFYAIKLKDQFVTSGRILPEVQSKNGSGLGQFAGLASLAGVDVGGLGGSAIDAIRPDLYPDVISSTPFFLALFESNVKTKDNKEIKFEKFYHQEVENLQKFDPKLMDKSSVKQDGILVINRLSEIRLADLRKRIVASIDKKTGIITITAKMPDPVVAAEAAHFAMVYLMEYVKRYRTNKLSNDVAFLQEQVNKSRGKYYTTQEKKAKYSDQFKDMFLQSADVQRERIESEYRISSTFYNELLKKLEEAKFKLHQETPVFQVLEPPVVPVKKVEPKRSILVILFAIAGCILAVMYVIFKNRNYKEIFYTDHVK
jgi:uncharacterized protein involved in exopolysaccharide biosynthesis